LADDLIAGRDEHLDSGRRRRPAATDCVYTPALTKSFTGNGHRWADESQVAELERKMGRQALWRPIFCGVACSM